MANTMLISAGGAPSTKRRSGRLRERGPSVIEKLDDGERAAYEGMVTLLGMPEGADAKELAWHKAGHALKGTTWGRRVLGELKDNYHRAAPYLAAELAEVVPSATYQGPRGNWKPDTQMKGDLEKVVNYIQVGLRR